MCKSLGLGLRREPGCRWIRPIRLWIACCVPSSGLERRGDATPPTMPAILNRNWGCYTAQKSASSSQAWTLCNNTCGRQMRPRCCMNSSPTSRGSKMELDEFLYEVDQALQERGHGPMDDDTFKEVAVRMAEPSVRKH